MSAEAPEPDPQGDRPRPKTSWPRGIKPTGSRIPQESIFYRHILPALILGMGVVTVLLILIAAGILLGIIPFQ